MHADAGVAIRPLVPDDLPAYKALRDAMLAAHPAAYTSDAAAERERPSESYLSRLGLDRSDGGHFLLGAFDAAGDLIGAIGCERDPRRKVRHFAHVTAMAVRDDQQRRGIGRALLDACIARSRCAGGIERLTMTVTASNAVALALYETAGFRRYGRLERALKLDDGNYHDKHLLVLVL